MANEKLVRMKCTECSNINYHTNRNKKKLKERLELKKYCKFCRKHTVHKELKK